MSKQHYAIPETVTLTYGEIKQFLFKELEYAKAKAFSGSAKIKEEVSLVVVSASAIMLNYHASEEVRSELGIRTLDLKYAMNEDGLTAFCKRIVLAKAGVPEKEYVDYRVEKLPYYCLEEPGNEEVIVKISVTPKE